MLSSLAVATDYWRHYIPVAPDIDITVVVGNEYFIDLRPYIMQGARDFFTQNSPDPLVIPDRVPSQRGWRLDYLLVVPPKKGKVTNDVFKNGFIYTPDRSAGNNTDCFNYQFSNGTQLSNFGRINVTIIKAFDVIWGIEAFRRDAVTGISPAEFEMKITIVPTHPSFVLAPVHGYRWYVEKIYVDRNTDFVKREVELVHQFRTYGSPETGETYIVSKADTLARRSYKTDSDIAAIDPKTNRRYVPKKKFPDIYVELYNYPHKRRGREGLVTDMSRPEIYTFKIQDYHTAIWNTSGKIKIPPLPPTPPAGT